MMINVEFLRAIQRDRVREIEAELLARSVSRARKEQRAELATRPAAAVNGSCDARSLVGER